MKCPEYVSIRYDDSIEDNCYRPFEHCIVLKHGVDMFIVCHEKAHSWRNLNRVYLSIEEEEGVADLVAAMDTVNNGRDIPSKAILHAHLYCKFNEKVSAEAITRYNMSHPDIVDEDDVEYALSILCK